ncbi:TATA box-binding protein-associated factor RNA polymerase I subunit B-like [Neltuma alba]|uniref:TATA box-binding protein-associated factor RNA polymerase I subunit B-like n=1 Tax=Neltuma alba TaxID=207710 RepID=UPI0010A578E3|nr:TATA box-binding protein-associated factor RNA polymerase I subunit B-like [Prosopis alba]
MADEDMAPGGIYSVRHRRKRTNVMEVIPVSQHDPLYDSQPQLWKALGLEDQFPQRRDDPSVLDDFGCLSNAIAPSYEDYYNSVRFRYLIGLQIMLQLQCETLVKNFKVNHQICDLAAKYWLKYVEKTNILGCDWADVVVLESEMQQVTGSEDNVQKLPVKHKREFHNILGERVVMIWYKSLSKMIPLDCTVAILFLACHMTNEAVLPIDISQWAVEGKLPYLSAVVEIKKRMGPSNSSCPIDFNQMFKPSRDVLPQKIETLAATIADFIGLEMPPVNFFEIASRYIRQLKLPYEKILPKAMLIYEWSLSPGLWLSTNQSRFPTRLCVLSIIIVAIRMLYNINGFGFWERSLSTNAAPSGSRGKKKCSMDLNLERDQLEEEATKLLSHLHSLYTGVPKQYV